MKELIDGYDRTKEISKNVLEKSNMVLVIQIIKYYQNVMYNCNRTNTN